MTSRVRSPFAELPPLRDDLSNMPSTNPPTRLDPEDDSSFRGDVDRLAEPTGGVCDRTKTVSSLYTGASEHGFVYTNGILFPCCDTVCVITVRNGSREEVRVRWGEWHEWHASVKRQVSNPNKHTIKTNKEARSGRSRSCTRVTLQASQAPADITITSSLKHTGVIIVNGKTHLSHASRLHPPPKPQRQRRPRLHKMRVQVAVRLAVKVHRDGYLEEVAVR